LATARSFTSLDFFAGSGLVSSALKPYFHTVWANDICPKKAKYYQANHADHKFVLDDIKNINGTLLPSSDLVWASFPCVDLSLAGNRGGLKAERSGLYWEWMRVVDQLKKRPKVLAIENVEGLYSSACGEDYLSLHNSLIERGYIVGPIVIDAKHWVPQSRVRAFVIAVDSKYNISDHIDNQLNWAHPKSVQKVINKIPESVIWKMPQPKMVKTNFQDVVDFGAPTDSPEKLKKNLSMVPERHMAYLKNLPEKRFAAPGYKRTRNGKQVLELRFDNLAGCLRVPRGGNSRQYVVIKDGNEFKSRLLTSAETARLMGAPSDFKLPGTYNETYAAMGDAVAYPVVKYLAQNLLSQLMNCKTKISGKRKQPKSPKHIEAQP
jgi:DNA (cytosine-5)-methyltransferase 1